MGELQFTDNSSSPVPQVPDRRQFGFGEGGARRLAGGPSQKSGGRKRAQTASDPAASRKHGDAAAQRHASRGEISASTCATHDSGRSTMFACAAVQPLLCSSSAAAAGAAAFMAMDVCGSGGKLARQILLNLGWGIG